MNETKTNDELKEEIRGQLPMGCLYLAQNRSSTDKNRVTFAEQGKYVLSLAKNLGGTPCNYCGSRSCQSRKSATETVDSEAEKLINDGTIKFNF